MSLDDAVRETLARRADQVDVPAPDLRRIMDPRVGEVGREPRWWYVGAAAAVVVLLAVGVTWVATRDGHRRVEPAPPSPSVDRTTDVQDLPAGAPPAIPYCWKGSEIRGVGGPTDALRSSCLTMASRGGTTIGWDETGVYLLRDGRKTLLDERTADGWLPVMSDDGTWAAWVVGGSPRKVVVKGLGDGSSYEFSVPEAAGWVPGIDAGGRVFVAAFGGGPVWVYDPAQGRLQAVRGLPQLVGPSVWYVHGDEIALRKSEWGQSGDETSLAYVGTVTDDARFVDQGTLPIGWAVWSPSGDRFVQEVRGAYWVQSPDDLDHHVTLRLPAPGLVTSYPVWETPTTLLVDFDPSPRSAGDQGFDVARDRLWLLRCAADTGRCEVALRPGNGGGTRGSMYR